MRDLLASLNDHPMALLRGIAELRGVPLATNVRDDAAAQLAAALAQPDATPAGLATCSPEAQAAWAELLAVGGQMKMPAFTRRHGAIRPVGPGRLEREQTWQQPANAAEELWYRGLIFRAFADFGDGPAEYVYIPEDLLPPGGPRQLAPTAPATPSLAAAPPPANVRRAFNSLAVDACALLAALRDNPPRADTAGHLHPADEARLRDSSLLPDPVRFALLTALVQELGWVGSHDGRLVINNQAAAAWLRRTPWEQITTLFQAWRGSPASGPDPTGGAGWNDLRRVPSLQAEGSWRNDPLLARHAILDVLGRLETGPWYTLADLTAWIKEHNPDFQRPDGNYTGWYLRDTTTGRYLSGFEAWDDVEGRLIAFLVTGPLFWLGAVVLGRTADGQIESFRLTQVGAAWLRGTSPPRLPRPAHLTVDEEFTVSAPLLVPLLDRFRLLRFTEPAAGLYELGQPTRHRIIRGSLARARSAGLKREAIVEFLRRASGDHLPPRVADALSRWGQHTGTVRVTQGAVLRAEDAGTLAALRADPVIAPLLGDLLSAQAVLVNSANLPKLLKALEELGYTAKVE
jgi:hypothetical protein